MLHSEGGVEEMLGDIHNFGYTQQNLHSQGKGGGGVEL